MEATRGATITLATPDGVADAYLARPVGEGPFPATLFFMDGIGLRPALRAMADRLASHGYLVLLPNLYYRAGAFPPFDPATIFTPGNPERERLTALLRSVDSAAWMRDTSAFLDLLAREEAAQDGPVGCFGYCLGGGLALTAAGTFPGRIAAAASFHGARLVTDKPDSPHLLAPKIKARMYFGVAGSDDARQPDAKVKLKEAFEAAKVPVEVELYPKALHGWCVSDMPMQGADPIYNQADAEHAWAKLLALYKAGLA